MEWEYSHNDECTHQWTLYNEGKEEDEDEEEYVESREIWKYLIREREGNTLYECDNTQYDREMVIEYESLDKVREMKEEKNE